jgi:hypothetical protein
VHQRRTLNMGERRLQIHREGKFNQYDRRRSAVPLSPPNRSQFCQDRDTERDSWSRGSTTHLEKETDRHR